MISEEEIFKRQHTKMDNYLIKCTDVLARYQEKVVVVVPRSALDTRSSTGIGEMTIFSELAQCPAPFSELAQCPAPFVGSYVC